jgi:hypothetical protein
MYAWNSNLLTIFINPVSATSCFQYSIIYIYIYISISTVQEGEWGILAVFISNGTSDHFHKKEHLKAARLPTLFLTHFSTFSLGCRCVPCTTRYKPSSQPEETGNREAGHGLDPSSWISFLDLLPSSGKSNCQKK